MEVSVMGSSQVNLARNDLGCKEIGFCNFSKNFLNLKVKNSKMLLIGQSFTCPSKSAFGFSLKASAVGQIEAVVSSENVTSCRKSKPVDSARVYVGLPLDAVSHCNSINHARAIEVGLKALKLLGVDGVELPIWWGIVEKEAMGKYDWTGYLALAEMVEKAGLKLRVSLCFHGSEEAKISLPEWVSRIGESSPSIYFTNRSGQHYKNCLSLAVDELPVLDGKSPIQVYKEFCENFKTTFSSFMGSTITGISVGLGPDGELRYPSHHQSPQNINHPGAGEFQCYDEHMLDHLKQHAKAFGNPLWGLSGPHDAPSSNEPPMTSNFFKEHGGAWETPYADFFLSWYSSLLISHGDRILSMASSTFSDVSVTVAGKVPLIHSWCNTRSHPAELTAGFYNTDSRDGYKFVAEMFARTSCKVILPGMDLSDEHEKARLLLRQIASSCRNCGVEVSGQNTLVSGDPKGFEQIKKYLTGENAVANTFTYQRMGADFFSPDHFPSFTGFLRNLRQPELDSDDVGIAETETAEARLGANLQMQAA